MPADTAATAARFQRFAAPAEALLAGVFCVACNCSLSARSLCFWLNVPAATLATAARFQRSAVLLAGGCCARAALSTTAAWLHSTAALFFPGSAAAALLLFPPAALSNIKSIISDCALWCSFCNSIVSLLCVCSMSKYNCDMLSPESPRSRCSAPSCCFSRSCFLVNS